MFSVSYCSSNGFGRSRSSREQLKSGFFLYFYQSALFFPFSQLPFMINISIKGIAIVFLLHEIYYQGDFLQFQWVTPFLIEIKSNIDYLFSGNWVGLTHLFRSLLFFILLAFMVYLLQYWLIQRKKIFTFLPINNGLYYRFRYFHSL